MGKKRSHTLTETRVEKNKETKLQRKQKNEIEANGAKQKTMHTRNTALHPATMEINFHALDILCMCIQC